MAKKQVRKGKDYRTSKKRDGLRKAKKFGYRKKGSNKTPTKKEIKAHNDGADNHIYYEGRVERADKSPNSKRGERFNEGGSVSKTKVVVHNNSDSEHDVLAQQQIYEYLKSANILSNKKFNKFLKDTNQSINEYNLVFYINPEYRFDTSKENKKSKTLETSYKYSPQKLILRKTVKEAYDDALGWDTEVASFIRVNKNNNVINYIGAMQFDIYNDYDRGDLFDEKGHLKSEVTESAISKLEQELSFNDLPKSKQGGTIDNEIYFTIVNHFVYFCFNYPDNFLSAWDNTNIKPHIQQKFDLAYEKAGAMGAIIKFWIDLDSKNRKIFADWIKANYDNGHRYEYNGSVGGTINHFVFFTLNYPQNFLDAWEGTLKDHMRQKFDTAYKMAGSYGAMIKFWSELDTENKQIFARWIKENYKGNKTDEFAQGGGVNNSASINTVTDLTNTSITPVANINNSAPENIPNSINPVDEFSGGGAMTHDKELSISEVESKIGRKLNLWKDDKVMVENHMYKKCYLRPYFKPLKN